MKRFGYLFIFGVIFSAVTIGILTIFISLTYAARAVITISPPNPISRGQDINIAINGRGFGNFSLYVGPENVVRELMLIFTVGDTGCKRQSGNRSLFPDFECRLRDVNQQTWTAEIIRKNQFPEGTYYIKLSDIQGQGWIANETLIIGTPRAQPLSVTISPQGPFKNDMAHEITILWTPIEVGKKYVVTSTIPEIYALPSVECASDPCSIRTTFSKGAPTGNHTITVEQADNRLNRGTATLQILSATVEKPSPPATLTPKAPPPCAPGKLIDGKCTEVNTAIGNISTDPAGLVNFLLKLVLGLSGGIAILLIIFGGYRLMTSQGNPEQLQGARETITSAIVGLLFIIFSLVLLEIIGVDILKIPGFAR